MAKKKPRESGAGTGMSVTGEDFVEQGNTAFLLVVQIKTARFCISD
jgi:hypothetical protein